MARTIFVSVSRPRRRSDHDRRLVAGGSEAGGRFFTKTRAAGDGRLRRGVSGNQRQTLCRRAGGDASVWEPRLSEVGAMSTPRSSSRGCSETPGSGRPSCSIRRCRRRRDRSGACHEMVHAYLFRPGMRTRRTVPRFKLSSGAADEGALKDRGQRRAARPARRGSTPSGCDFAGGSTSAARYRSARERAKLRHGVATCHARARGWPARRRSRRSSATAGRSTPSATPTISARRPERPGRPRAELIATRSTARSPATT